MSAQRARTAQWIVDGVRALAPLRPDCDGREALDTVWVLMDPAAFDRLTRRRHWSADDYRQWFATSVGRLLIPDDRSSSSTAQGEPQRDQQRSSG
jgi:hypothetical protein